MKKGIISLGEALIDFIPLDHENIKYQKSPGGAPANVAVGLARLGADVHFLGNVGQDSLGRFLKETLENYRVDTSSMYLTQEAKTGLVLVTNDAKGDRSFEFFIQPSADTTLSNDDIDATLFEGKKILHIGSISLVKDPAKSATWHAIDLAKKNDMLLSYDPNVRLSLWHDETEAKATIKSVLPYTDLLKLSEDELVFLTGEDSENAIQQLAKENDIPLIFVTRGEEGSQCYCQEGFVHVPGLKVTAVDTTGAGDAFVSAVIYQITQLDKPLQDIKIDELRGIAEFASISGGVTAATKGAMSALPTLDVIKSYM